ncbi:MAG: hypothetical protein K0S04_213 [Herbinix sp.]|jgi:predicted murein hydrolase (TIGR00659 family)|nr:hypothetical protein [Herbinix sp.]
MSEILQESNFFAVMLTIFSYETALLLKRKWDSPLCNPILLAVVQVIIITKLVGISNENYQNGAGYLEYFLTPATVCLAVPLYDQLKILKRDMVGILAGVLCGTATSLGVIVLLAVLFKLDHTLYVSLLPKSITTAMGLALSESSGGIAGVTTAAIIVTGILGSLLGTSICKLLKINHPIAYGVAFGTASHVIGTAKASEQSQLAGAVSSLSLVVAGIVTAVVFPMLSSLH